MYTVHFHHDTSCKQALAQLVTFSLRWGRSSRYLYTYRKTYTHANSTSTLTTLYLLMGIGLPDLTQGGGWEKKNWILWRGNILAPKWPHVYNRPTCLPVVSWIKDLIAMQYGAFIMTQVANRHSLSSSLFLWDGDDPPGICTRIEKRTHMQTVLPLWPLCTYLWESDYPILPHPS